MTDEIKHYCILCGEETEYYTTDPYADEFYPEQSVPDWYCAKCLQDSMNDI